MAMWRQGLLLLVLALALTPFVAGASRPGEDPAWAALAAGNHVVLIRHAATVAGIGDPPGFRKADCSTQRNLSAEGRAAAKRIGDAFRNRRIAVSEVWSSRWCRCLDTARLAFGKVQPAAMLDSMFNDPEGSDEEKLRALKKALRKPPGGGNLVLVTHDANINRLTGISVASGEMVIASVDGQGNLKVVGRLQVDRQGPG